MVFLSAFFDCRCCLPHSHASLSSFPPSQYLRNNVGLLFTNREPAEVKQWFAEYKQPEYARSGNKAGKTVTINEGSGSVVVLLGVFFLP